LKRILKYIKKKWGKGFTFMLVPNSSGGRVKSVGIPFWSALIITGIIAFNIYVFFAYTVQIKAIYNFQQDIRIKKHRITKLENEQKEVRPTLQRSYKIAEELSQLKLERTKLLTIWRAIQQKGGRVSTPTSRGVYIRTNPYILNPGNNSSDTDTSLTELNSNLEQIHEFINNESLTQKQLLNELLAYERKLDHTPSILPLKTTFVTSFFGNRFHPLLGYYKEHSGVDLKAGMGSKVKAAADGIVKTAGYMRGYGYVVIINHSYGYETLYAHNSRILVSSGQAVKKGQIISFSGNSGSSTGPHLHYEVHINGHAVNPVSFFRN
jgi:murein DD-endopeptidase MepM/ murein hydrolase activator NlpD